MGLAVAFCRPDPHQTQSKSSVKERPMRSEPAGGGLEETGGPGLPRRVICTYAYIYIHTQIHIHTYACLACCLLIELFIMRIYTYTDTHLYIGYFSRLRIYFTELYCNILSYSVLLHMTLGYMTLYKYICNYIYIY